MNLIDGFQQLATAKDGVKHLRELIFSLAVQGRLVHQDPRDESASRLLDQIATEKKKGVLNGGKGRIRSRSSDSIKQSGAGILPNGWIWTSLSEIGLINPRNHADDGLPVSFVQMSSIPTALIVPHTAEDRLWSEVKSGFTHFAEGDVGVAKITPCFENGKSTVFKNLTNGIGAGTTELHVVRPLGGVIPEYVQIFFKTPEFLRNGEKVMTGSAGQKRLPRQYVESVPFPLPPLAEQRRIFTKVNELMQLCDELEVRSQLEAEQHIRLTSVLFNALATSESVHSLAENWGRVASHFDLLLDRPEAVDALEQNILQLAVRGLLVQQQPTDEPACELLEEIREAKKDLVANCKIKAEKPFLPITNAEKPFSLPKGWEWVRFGDVSINRDGERIPVSSAEREKRPKVYDYYGASGVIDKIDGYLFDKTLLLIGEDGANLINRSTPIAFLASGKYWVNNHAHVVDTTHDDVMQYLCLFINSISLEPYITGTAQPKMNQAKLNSIVVAFPPLPEQMRIVSRVEELRRLCANLRSKLKERRACHTRLAEALVEHTLSTELLKDEKEMVLAA